MARMKIVLADFDAKYVSKVSDYINTAYASRFNVSVYTKIEALENHLNCSNEHIHILLGQPIILGQLAPLLKNKNIDLVIALVDGSVFSEPLEYKWINKYQPGDKLVNQMIELYAAKNAVILKTVTGSTCTQLVAVYSSIGGAGKTSMVLGLAEKLSEMGNKVFCLSLESGNSIHSILSGQGNNGFSHVMLALKENIAAVTLKIDMHKTRDYCYNVDFLEPPECFLEFSELNKEDIRALLLSAKELGKYDVVLIDTDAVYDDKTLEVLEVSDKIVYLQTVDALSMFKTQSFLELVKKIDPDQNKGITAKLLSVLNKSPITSDLQVNSSSLKIDFVVPWQENLWNRRDDKLTFNEQKTFGNCLNSLTKAILE